MGSPSRGQSADLKGVEARGCLGVDEDQVAGAVTRGRSLRWSGVIVLFVGRAGGIFSSVFVC